MPLPSRRKDEPRDSFVSRCMSDDKVKKEFPNQPQRVAVCTSKAMEGLDIMGCVDFQYGLKTEAKYIYENPRTGETFTYVRRGNYKKDGVNLIYKGKATENDNG